MRVSWLAQAKACCSSAVDRQLAASYALLMASCCFFGLAQTVSSCAAQEIQHPNPHEIKQHLCESCDEPIWKPSHALDVESSADKQESSAKIKVGNVIKHYCSNI